MFVRLKDNLDKEGVVLHLGWDEMWLVKGEFLMSKGTIYDTEQWKLLVEWVTETFWASVICIVERLNKRGDRIVCGDSPPGQYISQKTKSVLEEEVSPINNSKLYRFWLSLPEYNLFSPMVRSVTSAVLSPCIPYIFIHGQLSQLVIQKRNPVDAIVYRAMRLIVAISILPHIHIANKLAFRRHVP